MTRQQCKLCPWRLDVDPGDIPNGFNYEVHRRMGASTRENTLPIGRVTLHMMACHETPAGTPREKPCVGWVENQLGRGNNILLRLKALDDPELYQLRTIGKQRASYDEIRPLRHGDVTCTHERVKPGIDNPPLRSEICCDCGAWRTVHTRKNADDGWYSWEDYLDFVELIEKRTTKRAERKNSR